MYYENKCLFFVITLFMLLCHYAQICVKTVSAHVYALFIWHNIWYDAIKKLVAAHIMIYNSL
jgi:hypothetical protein